MKKLLILIVIALLTLLTVLTIFRGLQLGGLTILGIQGMKEKNSELESEIEQATKLASTDFPNALSEVENSEKELKEIKQKYEDMVAGTTENQLAQASQLAKYEQEKLYIQLDGHAKSEGVNISLVAKPNGTVITLDSEQLHLYDIEFTAVGSYIGVTDFIADIEDDSTLGFKIENFAMESNGNNEVKATFICRDIIINGITEGSAEENTQDGAEGQEGTTNSTTNNTTSNTTSNTTTNTTSNTTNSTSNSTNTSNTTNSTN